MQAQGKAATKETNMGKFLDLRDLRGIYRYYLKFLKCGIVMVRG